MGNPKYFVWCIHITSQITLNSLFTQMTFIPRHSSTNLPGSCNVTVFKPSLTRVVYLVQCQHNVVPCYD